MKQGHSIPCIHSLDCGDLGTQLGHKIIAQDVVEVLGWVDLQHTSQG